MGGKEGENIHEEMEKRHVTYAVLPHFPGICSKWQICDSRTLRFKSLVISHLLITLSDHCATPPKLQQPDSTRIKEKGAQRFCDSKAKWDLQSAAGVNWVQVVAVEF